MSGSFTILAITQMPYMSVMIMLCVFCLGGCLGSFANAAAMRLIRDEDIIYQASRCRACKRPLHILENLPFIGWLRKRGMCHCGTLKLPYRYIMVELVFAGLIVIYALTLPVMTAIGFSIAAIFIGISMLTDAEAMILHPTLLSILAIIGLVFAVIGSVSPNMGLATLTSWHLAPVEALWGFAVGALTPLSINLLYRLIRGQNGFGEGDFWMLGAIGAWTGWQGALSILVLAAASAALCGLFMILTGKASILTRLPFGIFLGGVFILWSIFLM